MDRQTASAGRSLGYQLSLLGAACADDHADRETDGAWSAEAFRFFVRWAQRQPGAFLAEGARIAAQECGAVAEPPDSRAWGSIVRRAAAGRLIKRVGYQPVCDPRSHGSPKSLWVWAEGGAQ